MTFLKIIIIIFILILIYNYLTREYKTKYPTILYFGLKGSGKTTLLTAIALDWIRKGKTVYCNYFLPNTIQYNPRRLGQFKPEPESLIICDEIALCFNNRNYQDFPKEVNEFITYQRQHKCTFICATQIFDSFDKKIRGQLDQLYQVKKFARVFVIARQIYKDIKPTDDETDITGRYHYAGLLVGTQVYFIPRYTEYFNSYDPPVLAPLYGERLSITDEQVRHLSTKLWLTDKLRESLKRKIQNIKSFPKRGKECFGRLLSRVLRVFSLVKIKRKRQEDFPEG